MNRLAISICLILVTGAWAQDGDRKQGAPDLAAEYDLLKSYYRMDAASYEFMAKGTSPLPLKMHDSVLTWTGHDYEETFRTVNPTSGEIHVWTHEGRVVLAGGVGSFAQSDGRSIFHEFHVMTEGSIETIPIKIRSPRRIWSPPGLHLKPIPGAAPPAKSASSRLDRARRLKQMRSLAKEFSAATKARSGKNDALQLQPTPNFRLDDAELKNHKSHVIDGGLFIFTGALGTDPELLLMIECHQTKNGPVWMYGPGRCTFLGMWLKYKDRLVWEVGEQHSGTVDSNFISEVVARQMQIDEIRQQVKSKKTSAK